MVEVLIGLIIGGALGSAWREIYDLRKKVNTVKEEPKASVTYGAYKPANESKQTPAIVNPKTPQRIQWEAENAQRKEVLGL